MRKPMMMKGIVLGIVLAGAAFAADRPLELTPEQYAELQQIQAEPEHVVIEDVHASYSSEREERIEADRIANDISTGFMQATGPVAIAIMLLLAAPL